jgi:integrase
MKGRKGKRREHKVPLSARAIAILKHMVEFRGGNPWVFPGDKPNQPLSNMAMLMLLRRMGRSETTHGFRSTLEDWAYECTGFPPAVVEMALAHTIKNAVERAYRRGDLFQKRRQLMDAWAKFCDRANAASGGNVTQIHQRAAS